MTVKKKNGDGNRKDMSKKGVSAAVGHGGSRTKQAAQRTARRKEENDIMLVVQKKISRTQKK
jgi:hypothetical protein